MVLQPDPHFEIWGSAAGNYANLGQAVSDKIDVIAAITNGKWAFDA